MSSDRDREPDLLLRDDEEDALRPKGSGDTDYDRIPIADGEECSSSETSFSETTPTRYARLMNTTLVPDDKFEVYGHKMLDGPSVVKFVKLVLLTFVSITITFHYVRWVGYLEHDSHYTLQQFWTYESTLVVCDMMVFFVVGRMYKQRGVDHLAWVGGALLCNIYSSYSSLAPFLQHSVSLYEMHCTWPWTLWAFLAIVIPVVVSAVYLHVIYAVRMRLVWMKLIELSLCIIFFMLPYATSPYFHIHHWYAGWLVGMHFNFDVWWSRLAMAWCFGAYVNGIAVWGRDPVLTCDYSMHLSLSQRCPYLKCYIDGINNHNDTNHTHVEPMITPDWRNCSATSYHP